MMSSQLDLQRPKVLNNRRVQSWFSLKNAERIHTEREIAGLNLGLNTNESAKIVQQNRETLAKEISVNPAQLAFASQVHGTEIKEIKTGGLYEGVDGFITSVPDLALCIQVADCAALLMGDPERGLIAAVHAGWRGAAGGIVPKAVKMMSDRGASPSRMEVFISPCIAVHNFEVGEEVARQFPGAFVDRENYKKPHVDLKAFLRDQLLGEGIKEQLIECDPGCTIDGDKEYYSFRREGSGSGRMMGIIKLNDHA